MKNNYIYIAGILLCVLCSITTMDAQKMKPLPINTLKESVVSLTTYNEKGEILTHGSGFIRKGMGDIVTTWSVMENADSATVEYENGDIDPVETIVGENKDEDIVILTTLHSPHSVPGLNMSVSPPKQGDNIIVLGFANEKDKSVIEGSISSSRKVAEFGNILSLNARITPQSIGSPVINARGEVVGIVTFQKVEGQNLNFVFPASRITGVTSLRLPLIHRTTSRTGTITGDFNGDGKTEFVWIVKPALDSTGMGCVNDCECIIACSDATMNSYALGQCIFGELTNVGDLDGDGRDELSLLPGWFTSAWCSMYLFTYRNNTWKELIDAFTVYIGDDYTGKRCMRSKQGYVTIVEDRWADDMSKILHERKEVKIK